MIKIIFDLITSPLSLFENPLQNYIAIALIGTISYGIAFLVVRELKLRGKAGSDAQWTIRLIVFLLIWLLCCIVIKIVTFIINDWILVTVCAIMLLIFYIVKNMQMHILTAY